MYNPTASSLTRQAWAYQQKLIDEMGMGQLPVTTTPVLPMSSDIAAYRNYLATCGMGFLSAGFAGYIAGKVGVLPTAIGVGLAYAMLKGTER